MLALDAVFPATELLGGGVVLGRSEGEVGGRPLALEDEAGVEGGDEETGEHDHDTLESEESSLVVGERAGETLLELGDTVDGTDEDENDGTGESYRQS